MNGYSFKTFISHFACAELVCDSCRFKNSIGNNFDKIPKDIAINSLKSEICRRIFSARAVFVIISGASRRAETLLEAAK